MRTSQKTANLYDIFRNESTLVVDYIK